MKKTISIKVDTDGQVTIEANGYTGAECESATFPYEKAFGKVGSKRLKPERFQQATEKVVQR